MGTNYYCRYNYCPECGSSEELHIGKSSAGWPFQLRIHPDKGISNIGDWLAFLAKDGVVIFNEYGDCVGLKKFLRVIADRKRGDKVQPGATPSQEGPWDYNNHEFS